MYQIKKGKNKTLDQLNKEHYEFLVKPKSDANGIVQSYGQGSVIKRIDRKVKEFKGLKGLQFFKDLVDNDYKLLNEILTGKPNELQIIVKKIERKIKDKKYPALTTKMKIGAKEKTFGEYIESVFNYASLTEKNKNPNGYDGYKLAGELYVNACPYCNRSYTITVEDNKTKTVRPEFDHFFCKKLHPYLAISFYNLIPSCHICNSNIKGDSRLTTSYFYHPYLQNFDDLYRFEVNFKTKGMSKTKMKKKDLKSIRFFYGDMSAFDLNLVPRKGITNSDKNKGKRHVEFFQLDKLYQYHKDQVIEYIQSAIINDDSKIDSIFKKYQGKLFSSKDEVKRYVSRNYVAKDELHLRPFSKLSLDIHHEFGLKL